MDNFKTKLNNLKQKPMLLGGIGCLILISLAAFVVYFVRVVYSPQWLGQAKGTFVLSEVFFAIGFLVWGFKNAAKGSTAFFMSGLIFISGVVFCFVNPPNQVPDEQSHFLRSYAIAMGDFDFDENQQWPNDVNLLMEHFPVAYNNGYPAKVGNTVYNRFTEYFDGVNSGQKGENHGIIIFQTIPYIPQAIGIFLARLFGIGALGAYYFGRLGNLIFYCICCFFALKTAKRWNMILFALMALPLTVFLAASNSNDSMFLGLMFCVFATVLSESFDNKMATAFALAMAILVTGKLSFIVLFVLLAAVDKEKWQIKFKKWQYVLISVAAFLVLYQGMAFYVALASNYGEIPRTMADSNPIKQLFFILQNPIRYLVIFLDTLRNNAFFFFSGGLFGWLDVNLKLISYFTPLVLVFSAFKNAPRLGKSDIKGTTVFFISSVLTYAVAMTGMYLSWTPVTLPQIIGLQMRYLLPAFMGILMVIALYLSKHMVSDSPTENTDYNHMAAKENSVIYVSFIFCLIAALLLFAAYYLPTKVIVYVS